jgi:hypothetical protein
MKSIQEYIRITNRSYYGKTEINSNTTLYKGPQKVKKKNLLGALLVVVSQPYYTMVLYNK